jgi:hypothetical protein
LIINDDNEEKEEYNQKKTRVEKIRTNMYWASSIAAEWNRLVYITLWKHWSILPYSSCWMTIRFERRNEYHWRTFSEERNHSHTW